MTDWMQWVFLILALYWTRLAYVAVGNFKSWAEADLRIKARRTNND